MTQQRHSPITHNVNAYSKDDGTKVKAYVRGSNIRKARRSVVVAQHIGSNINNYMSDLYAPAKFFGTTKDPNQSLWIMPDGTMISGSAGNKNPWSDYSHADVVKAYGHKPSDTEARLWMKLSKAIRMRRSSMAPDATLNIEMYTVPTSAQMSTISRAVDREGTIYADFWASDDKPIFSDRYRHAGDLRRALDTV